MWRVAARIGGVALGRPLIGSVLGSGIAAPALVRASLILPSLANLQHAEPTSSCRLPKSNLRVALLGLVAGAVLSQPDAAECMPPKKKAKAAPAAAPLSKKKAAGPSLTPIEAALNLQEGEYNMEKVVADRLVGGKKEYLVKWAGWADKHNSWEPVEHLANAVDEIKEYHKVKDAANAAHLKKLADEKSAREAARVAAGNATDSGAAGSSTDAVVVQAVEVKSAEKSKKTSRVYEAFITDPTDSNFYLCQSKENMPGGCVCGERMASYTQSLWLHLQYKHKRTWQDLKGLLAEGAPTDGGIVATVGALSLQRTLVAPKLTEPRKNECDRACARWLCKSARPVTLPEKDKPFGDLMACESVCSPKRLRG